jgi:nucleoside 2-deoxyribosyltransferase
MYEFERACLLATGIQEDTCNTLVQRELGVLKTCDVVVADVSIPEWVYCGTLMELVYARLLDIPTVVVVGESSIGNRQWLRAHASWIVGTIDEAAEVVRRLTYTLPK